MSCNAASSTLNGTGNWLNCAYVEPPDPSWTGATPALTSSNMLTNKGAVGGTFLQMTDRCRRVYNPQVKLTLALVNATTSAAGYNPSLAFLFSGYQPTTTINLNVAWSVEYPPTNSASLLVSTALRPEGPATGAAIDALQKRNPHLYTLPYSEASRVGNELANAKSADDVLKIVVESKPASNFAAGFTNP